MVKVGQNILPDARKEFAELFKIGDVVPSAALPKRKNSADLTILSIESDRVRYQPSKNKQAPVIQYSYLQLLLDAPSDLDRKNMRGSVNKILKRAGFEANSFSLAAEFLRRRDASVFLSSGEVPDNNTTANFSEGSRVRVLVEKIERDPAARLACLAHHGHNCAACDFNFEKAYGPIGKHYIHVHHLNQLAKSKGLRRIDPIKDLVPLCPNCHGVAHLRTPPHSVTEIQKMLRK